MTNTTAIAAFFHVRPENVSVRLRLAFVLGSWAWPRG
jgi:hypothetical protein